MERLPQKFTWAVYAEATGHLIGVKVVFVFKGGI